EGSDTNIAFGSFGSIESMMNAKREREKIVMIPTPKALSAPQWTIKKTLTDYDLYSGYDKLVLKESSFDEHIRRHIPEADVQKIRAKIGIIVNIYDYDLGTMHKLLLRRVWGINYGLMNGWVNDFVERRSLREKDEIGLSWDPSTSKLIFGVISRSKAKRRNSA
ncbi:hypothetical protein CARUB_v10022396mg, partial [Capsella rubella]